MSVTEHQVKEPFPCYYDFAAGADPKALLIAMHGYGGSKDSMLQLAKRVAPTDVNIVSLQGPFPHVVIPPGGGPPAGHGFGWITDYRPAEAIQLHHKLLKRIIAAHADGLPVVLLGFSQPVAMNLRFAFTFPTAVYAVIGVCGGIPGDWDDENAPYQSASVQVYCLGGDEDPIYPPDLVRSNAARLRQRTKTVNCEIYPGGHRFNRAMLRQTAAWLDSIIRSRS